MTGALVATESRKNRVHVADKIHGTGRRVYVVRTYVVGNRVNFLFVLAKRNRHAAFAVRRRTQQTIFGDRRPIRDLDFGQAGHINRRTVFADRRDNQLRVSVGRIHLDRRRLNSQLCNRRWIGRFLFERLFVCFGKLLVPSSCVEIQLGHFGVFVDCDRGILCDQLAFWVQVTNNAIVCGEEQRVVFAETQRVDRCVFHNVFCQLWSRLGPMRGNLFLFVRVSISEPLGDDFLQVIR